MISFIDIISSSFLHLSSSIVKFNVSNRNSSGKSILTFIFLVNLIKGFPHSSKDHLIYPYQLNFLKNVSIQEQMFY